MSKLIEFSALALPVQLDRFLADATARLTTLLAGDAATARLEARVLAMHALGVNRAWLVAHDQDVLPEDSLQTLEALLARRLSGVPVAYILGEREFYGRSFQVNPATLIPRPETEHLVEAALARLPRHGAPRVLDMGAGSGCIAITLQLERPDCRVTALDISAAALAVARANGERLGARVEWLESDLFDAVPDRVFEMIVSNPPYIASDDPHLGRGDLRFEPALALASGAQGLDAIEAIIGAAPCHLVLGGWLLLEHGWDQSDAVARRLLGAGFEDVFLERDLAGHARVSGGRLAV